MKKPRLNLKSLPKRFWITGAIVVLILALTAVFIRQVSAPSHGQITTTLTSKSKVSAPEQKPQAPASEIQTSYFNLPLPAGYRQQENNQSVPGLLYQKTIIKSSATGSLVIAIGLSSLGSGLSDSSAYRLRSQDPVRYKITSRIVNGESVVIANDAQIASVVAFWTRADKLATISISSGLQNPAANDNADEIKALIPLLDAWQWQ